MSTVKISQLPTITLNANTSNTLFIVVDTEAEITAKVTEYEVASSLFANNVLNVGQNPIVLSGVAGQFSGDETPYLQINLQNTNENGSGDYVVTADVGSDANNFIDLGINSSGYSDVLYSSMKALDGYLYVHGSLNNSYNGNLIIGTASSNSSIVLIAGGTTSSDIVGKINKSNFSLLKDVNVTGNISTTGHYIFSDASMQYTASSPIAYTQASFDKANTATTNVATANTFLQANDTITLSSAKTYTDTANTFLQSHYIANTSGVSTAGDFTVGGDFRVSGQRIYATKKYIGAQTAISLNFTSDSMLVASLIADLTITPTVFGAGREINVWLTNTNGTQRVVTHGITALNSTTNSTTFNIPATSSALLKYYSTGTDIGNTFVAITHA